jgi:Trk K+ transport system NAD-binding subunit
MANLYLYKNPVNSVFQLLGDKENDISYSVAWALSQSTNMLANFLKHIVGFISSSDETMIRLQEYRDDKGFTDIEIFIPGKVHIIAEAKRGWNVPNEEQLKRYAPRFKKGSGANYLLVLSECSKEYAKLL